MGWGGWRTCIVVRLSFLIAFGSRTPIRCVLLRLGLNRTESNYTHLDQQLPCTGLVMVSCVNFELSLLLLDPSCLVRHGVIGCLKNL
jgi:hypothetical protein